MPGLSVAVTGTDGFFGRALLDALEADPGVERVLALGPKEPQRQFTKTTWHRVDLVHPRSAETLADLLVQTDVMVHSAFLARPSHQGGWAHELEAIGTRHVLAAVEAAGVRKVVLRSTTLSYGASRKAPNYLPERAPLLGGRQSSFIADKIEAEEQVARFAHKNPERIATILRLAPLLGPTADTLATNYLRRSVCPTFLGSDPLVQLLHEEDAVGATLRAVHVDVRGAVNVGAPGVVPLSHAIELVGSRPVPLPGSVLRGMSELLWTVQLGDVPPGLVDFLRYLCVGDLTRMRDELGYAPRYAVREALLSFAGAARLQARAA